MDSASGRGRLIALGPRRPTGLTYDVSLLEAVTSDDCRSCADRGCLTGRLQQGGVASDADRCPGNTSRPYLVRERLPARRTATVPGLKSLRIPPCEHEHR